MRIISFPVTKSITVLEVGQEEDEIYPNFQYINVDWTIPVNNSNLYSLMLFQQVRNNALAYQNLGVTDKKSDKHVAQVDVFYRDVAAFKQEDFDTIPYANVLIHNGEYYGHVYTWTSDKHFGTCYVEGIRARVDSHLLKGTDKELSNISHYLLEGIRRFAICNGCYDVMIISPFRVMENILTELEFEPMEVLDYTIGSSIRGISKIDEGFMTSVMYMDDVVTPYVETKIEYILMY
jgi:hypothetical protein